MSSEELKPCPFCGGDVSFHKDEECPGCHLIQCGQCRAFFDFATGADPGNDCASVDALRAAIVPIWNTRAELAAIKGQEPNGWRLVPTEPTAEMLAAAWAAPIPAVWLDSISARDNLVQITKYRAMLAAAPSMPDARVASVGKHAHLYECTGCGGMYLEKVSQCDCMPDVQQFNEWIAYPKQSALAGEREALQRLLDDVRRSGLKLARHFETFSDFLDWHFDKERKTEAEKELDKLQEQIKLLQKQANILQAKMK